MQIIPVLDLLNAVVVRGVAGRRDEYRPVISKLTERHDPVSVAQAFRQHLGLTTLYLADLDAILQARPNLSAYRQLIDAGFSLLVDAGLRDADSAIQLLSANAATAVVGLETWSGPAELRKLCRDVGSERVIFSLDLKDGRPLRHSDAWNTDDAWEIAEQAIETGVQRLIVLDLAQVGVGAGVSTLDLCRALRERFPHVRVITGGGIRDAQDLEPLCRAGINGVLIASALHDGRIGRAELSPFLDGPQSDAVVPP